MFPKTFILFFCLLILLSSTTLSNAVRFRRQNDVSYPKLSEASKNPGGTVIAYQSHYASEGESSNDNPNPMSSGEQHQMKKRGTKTKIFKGAAIGAGAAAAYTWWKHGK